MVSLKFFSVLFFLIPLTYGTCPNSKCDNYGIGIRFPFRLQGHQHQNCSYPGFDLTCNSQRMTVLKLPHSGEFLVRYIDYLSQQIQLYDPNNCPPRRLLEFNISGSPFKAVYYQNYSFLSCPPQLVKSRFTTIDCLSNSTASVLATTSMGLARSMSTSCKIIVTLPIPVSWPVKFEDGFSSDLGSDLYLTWNVPDCRDCEVRGGTCGLFNNTSQQIVCLNESGSKRSGNTYVFRILALAITIPAMLCTIAIAFCLCSIDSNGRRIQASALTAVSPQPTIVTTGLDDSTIESYTKLVLGESRRLPGPNDNTCPICLADYFSKETVRCIPECKHCFHAQCIDEWLRMNNTCPVCRNSPSPAHVN